MGQKGGIKTAAHKCRCFYVIHGSALIKVHKFGTPLQRDDDILLAVAVFCIEKFSLSGVGILVNALTKIVEDTLTPKEENHVRILLKFRIVTVKIKKSRLAFRVAFRSVMKLVQTQNRHIQLYRHTVA